MAERNDIMNLPTRNPETGKPQLIDAILETPDGPIVIGTGFKTQQAVWDAAVRWRGQKAWTVKKPKP